MSCRRVLAVIGFPLALATLLQDEDNLVCDSTDCPESKSLLQGTFPHSTVLANRGAPHRSMSLPRRTQVGAPQRSMLLSREACPLDISSVANAPGNTEPLNAAGFENVRACCCPAQMREFIRRLVQADTNVVCLEGGLGGLTQFYYCNDYPEHDFDTLVASIGSDSDAQSGACPWIGFGPTKSLCPPQNPDPTVCMSFPGVTEPPCSDCETSTTTTTTTTTAPEVVSLIVKFDNIDYDAFVNTTNTAVRNDLIEEVRKFVNSKFPCPPCRPLTAQEIEDNIYLAFSKGSLIVEISTSLRDQSCVGGEVIQAYTDWANGVNGTTLKEDLGTAAKQVTDIDKVVTDGNDVTVNSNVTVKKVNTFGAGPCSHDFPWCNSGSYCEKSWCRYYGGCKTENYRTSRSCSSHYVPNCIVPSKAGYDLTAAGGTTTISGFNPSGVACAAGFVGKVSYTACSPAETPYSVSGCQATSSISYTHQCSDCYCSDVSGQAVRKLLGTNSTLLACKDACNDDPDCGYITYYNANSIYFNCYSCPLSGWVQKASDISGNIYSKVLTTSDWYGTARSI